MSGKWTPGPWEADFGEVIRIRDMSGSAIASVTHTHLSGRRDIAEVEDNARLIAAAPELAEALEAMVERFGHDIFTMPQADRDLLTRAVDVLAKAKGEGA